jgi:hypothetical protein
MTTIDEALKKDIYAYSTGDCWYSWVKMVGLTTGGRAWNNIKDLNTWESCPRIRPKSYPLYKDHANGRICAAHHLIAGPYKPESKPEPKSKSNICSCSINDLMAYGCSCGGE